MSVAEVAQAPNVVAEAALRSVGVATQHDSAVRHVCGSAAYVDDVREPEGTLHLAVGGAPAARGRLKAIDLAAVRAAGYRFVALDLAGFQSGSLSNGNTREE